jgi:peptidoglycan/LPS O-acetylase OafA/YrhL
LVVSQPGWLFEWEWIGVDLFFVLSGFLITNILLATRGAPGYFWNFYARRVLRIFPLYYCVLLVTTVLFPLARGRNPVFHGDVPWVWAYLTNLRIVSTHNWLYGAPPFKFDHFWSLAVEEQFYFVWPVVVLTFTRRKLVMACIAGIVLAFFFRTYLSFAAPHYCVPFVHPLARMDVLCWGALIAVSARERDGSSPVSYRAATAVGLATGLGLAVLSGVRGGLRLHDPWVLRIALTLTGPFCAALVLLATTGTRRSWLEWAPLRWLGTYSYGLYVLHGLAIGWIFWLFSHGSDGLRPLRAAGFVVVATGVPLACAVASYHFLEQPFLRLKRFFPYLSEAPAPEAAAIAEGD